MPNNSKVIKNLKGHLHKIEVTRGKVELLYAKKKLTSQAVDLFYKGLFIELSVTFEKFIEDLFIGLLSNNVKITSSEVKSIITFKTSTICRKIIVGDKSYVDWIPYEYTIKRANKYFKDGLPFTSLLKNEKDLLEEINIIRNAIAHKSIYSHKKFEKRFINSSIMLQREKTVTGYLRSVYSNAPIRVRFQRYIYELAAISQSIINKL